MNPTDVLFAAPGRAAEKPTRQIGQHGQRPVIAIQYHADSEQHAAGVK